MGEGNTCEFYVAQSTNVDEKRWALLVRDGGQDRDYYTLCVFPLGLDLRSKKDVKVGPKY
jgi:hypothetical protein